MSNLTSFDFQPYLIDANKTMQTLYTSLEDRNPKELLNVIVQFDKDLISITRKLSEKLQNTVDRGQILQANTSFLESFFNVREKILNLIEKEKGKLPNTTDNALNAIALFHDIVSPDCLTIIPNHTHTNHENKTPPIKTTVMSFYKTADTFIRFDIENLPSCHSHLKYPTKSQAESFFNNAKNLRNELRAGLRSLEKSDQKEIDKSTLQNLMNLYNRFEGLCAQWDNLPMLQKTHFSGIPKMQTAISEIKEPLLAIIKIFNNDFGKIKIEEPDQDLLRANPAPTLKQKLAGVVANKMTIVLSAVKSTVSTGTAAASRLVQDGAERIRDKYNARTPSNNDQMPSLTDELNNMSVTHYEKAEL